MTNPTAKWKEQKAAFAWALQTYGEQVRDRRYQGMRFLEEALELAQAMGLNRDDMLRLVDYVAERPTGAVYIEIGDARFTLDILGATVGVDVEEARRHCVARIAKLDPEKMREKDQGKIEAGLI